ncbi:hypothetical protein AcV5_007228 [Taiwanofungus camphoratus]|nr:hypothetical protein AcV5_007228 [Antrodia cinnamomea]
MLVRRSDSMSRSRRKACQACAESKVKCDMQHPCSKCKSRRRDCVYITGHSVEPRKGSQCRTEAASDATPALAAVPILNPSSDSEHSRSQSVRTHSSDLLQLPTLRGDAFAGDIPLSSSFPLFSSDQPNFFIDSSSMFARIDQTSPATSRSHADELFSNEVFDNLFGDLFYGTPGQQPSSFGGVSIHYPNGPARMTADRRGTKGSLPSPEPSFLFPTDFFDLHRQLTSSPRTVLTVSNSPRPTEASKPVPEAQSTLDVTPNAAIGPSALELDIYLSLFFSAYLPNMPIIHAPTFERDGKPPILLTAMRACGALYMKTRTAINYIDSILAQARDELVVEFAKNPTDWQHQINLALAVDLLQTLGLFHHNPEQRAFSTVYHGMLTMMLRMNGFAEQTMCWVSPTAIESSSASGAWREWTIHETAKRALAVSYLHDCCHCIYYNLRPTYLTSEFDLCLPCEDALWTAASEIEWLAILQKPSPYGSLSDRLCGPRLRDTYDKFASQDQLSPPLVLNPCGHFVVIHAILRHFFEEFLEARLPELGSQAAAIQQVNVNYISDEKIVALQIVLHHWLHSWLNSPETPLYSDQEPRFMIQALPYYWIAQVAILAYQERLPPFCPGTTFLVHGDAKFRLMKKWERHIRNFLRRGGHEPTLFLDELINYRIKKWQAEMGDNGTTIEDSEDESEILLGFFPET